MRGENNTPARDTTTSRMERRVRAILASSRALSLDLFLRYSVKTGINATVREPSPKSRLSRLGIRKATKKASVAIPAPKKAATTISLINPKIRLSIVASPTIPAARATFSFSPRCAIYALRPDAVSLRPSFPESLSCKRVERRFSRGSRGTFMICTIFLLDVCPLIMSICPFFTPRIPARNSRHSSLAFPSTGGAVSLILSAPSCAPARAHFADRGNT
ncbi:MAG: hypothetical protein A4E74_02058 [Syntrophus sp. PtaB.Bin075]|nr:MAG: hypothetical protein A4E74_02058 [Syntrophus sp. PtaB.Bin075]